MYVYMISSIKKKIYGGKHYGRKVTNEYRKRKR